MKKTMSKIILVLVVCLTITNTIHAQNKDSIKSHVITETKKGLVYPESIKVESIEIDSIMSDERILDIGVDEVYPFDTITPNFFIVDDKSIKIDSIKSIYVSNIKSSIYCYIYFNGNVILYDITKDSPKMFYSIIKKRVIYRYYHIKIKYFAKSRDGKYKLCYDNGVVSINSNNEYDYYLID